MKWADTQPPTSIAERWDVYGVAQTHPGHRALAAALGICSPAIRRRLPYDGRPGEYGGRVIDALVGDGVSLADVLAAGRRAYDATLLVLVDVGGAGPSGPSPAVAPAGPTSGAGSPGDST